MTIRKMLLAEHSKRQTMKVVRHIGSSPVRFKELIDLITGDDPRLAQRAAWPLGFVVEEHPELIKPLYKKCLRQLALPCHNAIRRNILDAFAAAPIPVRHESELIEICFRLINDNSEYTAVRALAMTIIGRLIGKYPDLLIEFESSVRMNFDQSSPGFKSRVRKVLNNLKK